MNCLKITNKLVFKNVHCCIQWVMYCNSTCFSMSFSDIFAVLAYIQNLLKGTNIVLLFCYMSLETSSQREKGQLYWLKCPFAIHLTCIIHKNVGFFIFNDSSSSVIITLLLNKCKSCMFFVLPEATLSGVVIRLF